MNYRSVTVLGRTRPVDDPREKEAALRAFVEHVIPGRSDEIRGGDRGELAATVVLAVPLQEVSAKVRTGPPRTRRRTTRCRRGRECFRSRVQPRSPAPAHVADWSRSVRLDV
jgi:nitroimidazol reductase NimA-like FMN-containing flavoprotein (pyridoxamine 5'-phosphate oxidase superfamily)